jgi:hypothetical protein
VQGSDRGERNSFISERSSRGCSSPTNDSQPPSFESIYTSLGATIPRSRSGLATEAPSPSKVLAQTWSLDSMDRGYGRYGDEDWPPLDLIGRASYDHIEALVLEYVLESLCMATGRIRINRAQVRSMRAGGGGRKQTFMHNLNYTLKARLLAS